MNKENIPVITDREKLYDKCENMEQLFDKYYLPLLDKHYSKTYELQQENKQLKEELVSANESITWWNNRFNAVTRDNKHLKDNWNKLKDYIKETKLKEFEKSYGKRYGKTFTQAELIVCNMILDKMQELEGSDE